MQFFKNNLSVLKMHDGSLASTLEDASHASSIGVTLSKSGHPIPRVGDKTLHSTYDPILEARKFIEKGLAHITTLPERIIVLGFGFGYHLKEILRLVEEKFSLHNHKALRQLLYVVEDDPLMIRSAAEHIDLTDVFSSMTLLSDRSVENIYHSKKFESLRMYMTESVHEGAVIYVHYPPSIKNNSWFYERFLHLGQRLYSKFTEKLKIMVVYPMYGGSHPVAGYCAEAFRNLGHDVIDSDFAPFYEGFRSIDNFTRVDVHKGQLKSMYSGVLAEAFLAQCYDERPDLVFALAQAPVTGDALSRLKELKIPAAFWFCEDYRFMDYWKDIAPHYDYFFTVQRGDFFAELKRIGVTNFTYLPMACSPTVHRHENLNEEEFNEYGSDVSFMGAGYRNRNIMFQGIVDFDFKVWGNGWDLNSPLGGCVQRENKRIPVQECVHVFNGSKININLHSSSYVDGVNPFGDFVNPRTFEIAACGGFQLVDYRQYLPEMFEIGKEIICFEDLDDLRGKIRYYIERPEERESIAHAARERTLRDHTYEIRMQEALSLIFEGKKFSQRKPSNGKYSVEHLIEEAGETTELGRYLSRYERHQEISLMDIIDDVQSGQGKLNEVETIFLLMNEFIKKNE